MNLATSLSFHIFPHICIFSVGFNNLARYRYVPFPRSLLLVAKSDFFKFLF